MVVKPVMVVSYVTLNVIHHVTMSANRMTENVRLVSNVSLVMKVVIVVILVMEIATVVVIQSKVDVKLAKVDVLLVTHVTELVIIAILVNYVMTNV